MSVLERYPKIGQVKEKKKFPRWYFGGLASAGAAAITHPLDLLKVLLQARQNPNEGLIKLGKEIVQTQGFWALYRGISAAMLRQMSYSTARFGIYSVARQHFPNGGFLTRATIAGVAGFIGGTLGTPADLVNVRMQNDIILPEAKRKNYKNAFDGLYRIGREEGITTLFSGGLIAASRATLMNICQLSFYDQFKDVLINFLDEGLVLNIAASLAAAMVSVIMIHPVDVVKTKRMLDDMGKNGKGNLGTAMEIYRTNVWGFYYGLAPSAFRLIPGTIIMFVLLEKLTVTFGYEEEDSVDKTAWLQTEQHYADFNNLWYK